MRERKHNEFSLSVEASGPLLERVLEAQRADEAMVTYPRLAFIADAVISCSAELGDPLVWPVGEPAERLAGAAVVRSRGKLRVRGWNSSIVDERVLLLTGVLVTPLPLVMAAQHAEMLGARVIHACGVRVDGLTGHDEPAWLQSFTPLSLGPVADTPRAARTLVSAAN